MNSLFAAAVAIALAVGDPHGMQPRVLMGDLSHCDAVMVRNGHIVVETVCVKGSGNQKPPFHAEVTWDGQVATITASDEKASAEWIRAHSLLPRLSRKHSDLYWDGRKVDLGKIDVYDLYQAIPWQGGVLIYGATVPRKGFFGSWPFKGPFFDVREMEPFCAIFFDPNTLKGEDLYLNGFAYRGFFVFPIPD
ncbi:MAG TPA: hypothetical protein VKH18_05030 [Terriglobales bacterium]|nr:hypothetical protein [Terriglobales bacterium]